MANTFAPFGLRQVGYSEGAAPTFGLATRTVSKNDSTAIYFGDPVEALSTGYIAQWTAGHAANTLGGIFAGCKYLNTSGQTVWSMYWPGAGAAQDVEAYVISSLNTNGQFLVQSSSSAVTIAALGANADITLGTGNTLTGLSGAYLATASINTTNTLPFKIVGLYQGIGNGSDAASAYNWVVVQFNSYAVTGT